MRLPSRSITVGSMPTTTKGSVHVDADIAADIAGERLEAGSGEDGDAGVKLGQIMRSRDLAASRWLTFCQNGPTSFSICQAKRFSASLEVAQQERRRGCRRGPAGQPLIVMRRFTPSAIARSRAASKRACASARLPGSG